MPVNLVNSPVRLRRLTRLKRHDPTTVYHESVVVKQLLRWCVSRRLLNENPLQDCRLEKPVKPPKSAPSLAAEWMILAAARPKLRTQLAVLAFTGIRVGELQKLRKADVDLAGNWIAVISREGAETKTRQSRRIPIHPTLRRELLNHVNEKGEWFSPLNQAASIQMVGTGLIPKR